MAGLPKSGVQLVAEDAPSFMATLNAANRGIQGFAEQAATSAQKVRALDTTIGNLSSKIGLQKRELDLLKSDLTATAAKYGESSQQAQKKQLAVDKLSSSIATNEGKLEAAQRALQKEKDASQQSTQATDKFSTAETKAGSAATEATPPIDKLGKETKDAGDKADDSKSRFSGFAEVVTGALRRVGEIAVNALADAGRAMAGFIKDSINVAGDFEQTMNVLQATSGATAEEMDAVSKKATDLGADLSLPATSAVDAGKAMLELSKAGFTTQQAMDAAKGTLQLAAAAQIDEAQAAEITANAINAFQLSANDAVFVSDLLAASANASSLEITDVAKSFQMAGAVFSNFQGPVVGSKQAIIDLTTATALLGNAGIKGSDAGTSLKQALLQLTGPSDKAKGLMRELAKSIGEEGDIAYDAQGKMRSFPEILGLVSRATAGLTEEKRNQYITDIFGADASRAILVLMQQGPDAWAKMEAAVKREGAAKDLAAAQTRGFKGALEGAKSQIETFQLVIGGKLLPLLATLINTYITPAISQLTLFAQAIFGDKEALEQLTGPLASILSWITNVTAGFGYWEKGMIGTKTMLDLISPALGQFAPIVDRVREVVGFLSNNFSTIFNLISGGNPKVFDLVTLITDLGTTFGLTTGQSAGLVSIMQTIGSVVNTVITSFQSGGLASQALGGYVSALQQRWAVLWPAIQTVVSGIMAVVIPIFTQIQTFLAAHGDKIVTTITTAWNQINSIINTVIQIVSMVVSAGLQTISAWITAHGTEIQRVIETAWRLIASVIETTLNVIQGIVNTVLLALQGDWKKAWETLKNTSADFVLNIKNIIINALNFIASFFGTSLKGIKETWDNNWNMMVEIVTKVVDRVKNVGSAIVNAIKKGFEDAWNGFVASAKQKLDEFRAMLPFSDPKDSSSPLYGLSKSGEAIVSEIQKGLNAAPPLSLPTDGITEAIANIGDQARGKGKKGGGHGAGHAAAAIPSNLVIDTKEASNQIATTVIEATEKIDWETLYPKIFGGGSSPAATMPAHGGGAVTKGTGLAQLLGPNSPIVSSITSMARVGTPMMAVQMPADKIARPNPGATTNFNMPIYTNQSTAVLQDSMAIAQAMLS